mmetsp:Transcript_108264/g.248274  ORF Transcript_108264/g.248274 Transcript_108264/m.248274 type:complete len:527 (-) Transcript_108264:749-2329(-)
MAPPVGHNLHFGYPILQCSKPFGASMLREIDPDHPMLLCLQSEISEVSVVWGDCESHDWFELAARVHGEEIARSKGRVGDDLRLSLPGGPGEECVVALRWPDGSRHLHVINPLDDAHVRRSDLLAIARSMPTSVELSAPCKKINHPSGPCRGFGVELEFVVPAADPESSGYFTKADEVMGVVDQLIAQHPDIAPLHRCKQWWVTTDPQVEPLSEATAARLLAWECANHNFDEGSLAPSERDRLRCMLSQKGIMCVEYKAPHPPHELSFSENAAADILCFFRLVQYMGAVAPTVAHNGYMCAALHTHVNIRNPAVKGTMLSPRQVVGLWVAWVQFELVTRRFYRSWAWRDRSSTALFATGTECSWHEVAWKQGSGPVAGEAEKHDVPTLFKHFVTTLQSEVFQAADDSTQMEMLFRKTLLHATCGKQCSLNLLPIWMYGTVEFRGMTATLNEEVAVAWSHFCVSFVEVFQDTVHTERFLSPSWESGLRYLQEAQEKATVRALLAVMKETMDSKNVWLLLAQSCAPKG